MIAAARPCVLNEFGKPYERNPAPQPDALEQRRRGRIDGTYDAARDSVEFDEYWKHVDSNDADSANSQAVRAKMVPRSRYETANNGFVDGMVQTQTDYLVGKGPSLRMQTSIEGFNSAVELRWYQWAKAILLRRKLWCMAHAKSQDGEGMGLVATNNGLQDPVKLDLLLFETEQCQTPMLPWATAGYVDGIKFDAFGNPEWYDVLPAHPGSTMGPFRAMMQPRQVPAEYVVHWFKLRRPGQHRGVPELRSTLLTGASGRRFREATVAAAESAAELNVILSTTDMPDSGAVLVRPFAEMPLSRRMATAMPMGWDAKHFDSKHPNATYESFARTLLNEQARPFSMPYNLAACDSSRYNYASGRLDHQTFFGKLDVDRLDGDDLVMDKLFAHWWREAVLVYGWNADPNQPPLHTWDWPQHPVADIVSEANAINTRLKNGTLTLTKAYADRGEDFQDAIVEMAADYGVSVPEMRAILLRSNFPTAGNMPGGGPAPGGVAPMPAAQEEEQPEDEEALV